MLPGYGGGGSFAVGSGLGGTGGRLGTFGSGKAGGGFDEPTVGAGLATGWYSLRRNQYPILGFLSCQVRGQRLPLVIES